MFSQHGDASAAELSREKFYETFLVAGHHTLNGPFRDQLSIDVEAHFTGVSVYPLQWSFDGPHG